MTKPLRSTPAAIKTRDGEVPARIVTPAWTRAELEDLVRGEAERGLITREHADRLIADGQEKLREDGTPVRRRTRSTR